MTNKFILATSGFIIPENSYYTQFTEEDIASDSIFNRSIITANDTTLINFFKTNQIYRSKLVNQAYEKYESTKSFEDYMTLIDFVIDILKDINFGAFFKIQADNRHLSNISFMFCRDVYSGKFMENYLQYNAMPFNARFTINNGNTSQTVAQKFKELDQYTPYFVNTWEQFMTEITNNRDAFLIFYKYIFADYY